MEIKHNIAKTFMLFLRIFPVKKNKIVVDNFNGKGYGDSGKYIIEEILKKDQKYDIVWLCNSESMKEEFPLKIRKVPFFSIRAFYELATAKFWIDNVRKPYFILKRKGQFYIQTWHGGIALKRIEKDAEKSLSLNYLRDAKADSLKVDLMVSNSKFFTTLVKKSFWYEGEIAEIGLPRNDVFFKEKERITEKIKKIYGISDDTRLVMYAPTFRKETEAKFTLDSESIIHTLKQRFGGEWKLMIRCHPNDVEKMSLFEQNDPKFINASLYGDMQELLAAADVLITDYSATMFEFSMMKKPVFLYTYDLDEYVKDRNFYFSINELPYSHTEAFEGVLKDIENFSENEYEKKLEHFFENVELYEDGNASAKICARIESEMNKKS